MEEGDSCDVLTLEVLYERYVMACGELGAEPLAPDHLLALIDALVQRMMATVN